MQNRINIRRLAFFLTGRMPPYYSEGISKGKFYNLLHKADASFGDEEFWKLANISNGPEELFHLCLERINDRSDGDVILADFISILETEYHSGVPMPQDALYSVTWRTAGQASRENEVIRADLPTIFTEWKTDSILIKLAWLSLNGTNFSGESQYDVDTAFEKYNKKFKVESCNLFGASPGERGGAKILAMVIRYWKWSGIAIGLFDRDKEWQDCLFSIGKDDWVQIFQESKREDSGDLLIYKNDRNWKACAIGLCYPIPSSRSEMRVRDSQTDDSSFVLECHFSDKDIRLLSPNSIEEVTGTKGTAYTQYKIRNKIWFSKQAVLKREELDFEGFRDLFAEIEFLIEESR